MIELWESSVSFRVFINIMGVISILVGIWIIARVFKRVFFKAKNDKALAEPFLKIMSFDIWREFVENSNRKVGKQNGQEAMPISRRFDFEEFYLEIKTVTLNT